MASSSSRLLDRLDQVARQPQLAAAPGVRLAAQPTSASSPWTRPAPGSRWIRSASAKPSISGICASSSTSANGFAGGRRPLQLGQRRRAAVHRVGRISQLRSISSRMRRLVALSSTTSDAQPAQVAGGRQRGDGARLRAAGRSGR